MVIFRKLAPALLLAVVAAGCSGGQSVSFRTQDGFELGARMLGDASTGVVLAHHSSEPTDRNGLLSGGMWHGFERDLAKVHRVLVVDLRGQGDSEGTTDPLRLSRDIAAAVNFLQRQGSRKVIVIGSQVAGAAALQAAASGDLEGVVTLSITDEGGLDPLSDVAQAQTNLFFAASVDHQETAQFAKELLSASLASDSGFHLASGNSLGPDLLDGRSGDRLRDDIKAWIVKVMA